jgi:hypothetical protein
MIYIRLTYIIKLKIIAQGYDKIIQFQTIKSVGGTVQSEP